MSEQQAKEREAEENTRRLVGLVQQLRGHAREKGAGEVRSVGSWWGALGLGGAVPPRVGGELLAQPAARSCLRRWEARARSSSRSAPPPARRHRARSARWERCACRASFLFSCTGILSSKRLRLGCCKLQGLASEPDKEEAAEVASAGAQ